MYYTLKAFKMEPRLAQIFSFRVQNIILKVKSFTTTTLLFD